MERSTLERIQSVTKLMGKDDYQVLAAIIGEAGELAEAMAIEDKLQGKAHKTNSEPATYEAIDLVITTLSLYFQRGGTMEDIDVIMNRKLKKAETMIKPKDDGPHGEDCTNYMVENCPNVCWDCMSPEDKKLHKEIEALVLKIDNDFDEIMTMDYRVMSRDARDMNMDREELEHFRKTFLGKDGKVKKLFGKLYKSTTTIRSKLAGMLNDAKNKAESKLEELKKT